MAESFYTADELMVSQISRLIRTNDIVFQGYATFVVFAAFILAKLTHGPNIYFFYSVGNSLAYVGGKIGISRIEELTLRNCLKRVRMTEVSFDLAPNLRPVQFMRPAQVDGRGNFNNTVIGRYERPKVRLPGGVGIPDATNFNDNLVLYVPRHTATVLVEKIDFRTGLGYGDPAEDRSCFSVIRGGPRMILTDLCVFEFEDGCAKLTSLHPGVSLDDVKVRTGFEFKLSSPLEVTKPPTIEELRLIREEIDPLGVRRTEFLTGPERLAALKKILILEDSQSVLGEFGG